jgi:tetratricopeptide (TPR) repeat protein
LKPRPDALDAKFEQEIPLMSSRLHGTIGGRIGSWLGVLALAAAPAFGTALAPRAAGSIQDPVQAHIDQGRLLFAAGKLDEALAEFEQAAAADNQSMRTRLWVLRTWIEQGRTDDALYELSGLESAGTKGPELDYLMGMCFHRGALLEPEKHGAWFEEATPRLKRATAQPDERFQDAFAALAESAWYTQDLDTARAAVETAVKLAPKDAAKQALFGRIAFSQYVVARADQARETEAEAHWQSSVAAFQKALELLGDHPKAAAARQAADARAQLADLFLWKEQPEQAREAWVAAIGLDPEAVDFARVAQKFPGEAFLKLLEEGAAAFKRAHGGSGGNDAILVWWLGWSAYDQKQFAKAEQCFTDSLKKNPGFTNAWYYLFRARYDLREFEPSFEALQKQWESDPDGLLAALAGDAQGNLPRLAYLVDLCADPAKNKGQARNLDAAFLSELCTRIAPPTPENSRYWNNLGLFLRDHGDFVRGGDEEAKNHKPVDPAVLKDLWERAYRAYTKALELEPDNPGYLNDTAVMLHYYLKRDFEQAKALYEKASRRAEEELAKKDLSPDLREWYQTAKRDSGNNLRKLEAEMKRKVPEKPPQSER